MYEKCRLKSIKNFAKYDNVPLKSLYLKLSRKVKMLPNSSFTLLLIWWQEKYVAVE